MGFSNTLEVYCNKCSGKTKHTSLHQETNHWGDEDDYIQGSTTYSIVKCDGCSSFSYRSSSSNSEDRHPETGEYEEYITLYPPRTEDLLEIKPYYTAPEQVSQIYRETIMAYNCGMHILCAAGLRAIIESVCIHEEVDGGLIEEKNKDGTPKLDKDGKAKLKYSKQLDGKINGLASEGHITKKQCSILHEHRYLGNEALHEIKPPHKKVLKVAVVIIEHVLDMLYDIEQQAGELVRRRQLSEANKKKKK